MKTKHMILGAAAFALAGCGNETNPSIDSPPITDIEILEQVSAFPSFEGFDVVVSESIPAGRLFKAESVEGSSLLPRDVFVWLPDGYDQSGDPIPVIYMHDAQNLFERGKSYTGDEWEVDEALTRLIEAGTIPPVMVVALGNTSQRWQDYVPAKVLANLPDDLAGRMKAAQGGEALSDAYLRLIVENVKPVIDAQFNTASGRETTFIAGSSMGGLISLYAAAEYPNTFGGIAALSIHWPLADPRDPDALSAIFAMQNWLVDSDLRPSTQRLYFDRGTLNLDATYPPYADAMEQYFEQRRWPAEFRVYEGTDHNEQAWAARLDEVFTFLLADLPPQAE